MKRAVIALVSLLMLVSVSAFAQSVPLTMNFQGRLAKPDGTPVPDNAAQPVTFRAYAAATGGTALWVQTGNVAVHNGAFAVALNFAAGYQSGNTLVTVFGNALFTPYLEIQVGSNAPLTPQQAFASNAYALYAGTALTVPANSITNANIVSVDWSKITNAPSNPGGGWSLNGNAGINPLTQFLGTTDNQPLVLKVNGRRAGQYSYAENTGSQYRSVNMLGGSEINSIAAGVVGATIAGGGRDSFTGTDVPNIVTADFGAIGGGLGNTAGVNATVAGGFNNTANGNDAAVGGGSFNIANTYYATVAGGNGNTASGNFATVGGGMSNTASGQYSFAAGQQARANHDGSFVWNDSTSATDNVTFFTTTGVNQFLIHASGGVGINTNSPGVYALNVSPIGAGNGINATGASYGVFGAASVSNGTGVHGEGSIGVHGYSSDNYGVYGISASGYGILGKSATNYGVVGISNSTNNRAGVYGTGNTGVEGDANTTSGEGVTGVAAAGNGVHGTSATGIGVHGASASGIGVYGTSASGYAGQFDGNVYISGATMFGGMAQSLSGGFKFPDGTVQTTAAAPFALPYSSAGSLENYGIFGITNKGAHSAGIIGDATGVGVWGLSEEVGGTGILGFDEGGGGYGVRGYSGTGSAVSGTSASGNGVYGSSNNGYAGYFAGNVYISGSLTVNGMNVTSDARYKTNIAPLNNALDDVLNLRGVSYDWDRAKWPAKNFSDTRQIGFIAQELEKIFPELVQTDKDGYKSVNYIGVVPVLVEAVKTQQKELNEKQKQMDALQQRVNALEAQNAEFQTLKKQMSALAEALKKMQESHDPR